ncbi:MAG: T9SS type A sorting domain-containing protein [Saprospiraceae bacterium]
MIIRFSPALFAGIFILSSISVTAQSFAVQMDSAEAKSGEVVCLSVKAHGFTDITSYQYSLSWDPDVLSFHHTQNFNLQNLTALDFNEYPDDILLAAWASQTGLGVTKTDGTTLYEVCFTAIGALGSSTEVSIGSNFPPSVGPAEAFNFSNQNVWNPNFNVVGFVEVTLAAGSSEAGANGNTVFQISPNPTSSSARVQLKSAKSETAMLSVADAQGRVVFETKISVKVGNNSFEIPAKVLTAKGMYQVSLKTAAGVASEMLSVN